MRRASAGASSLIDRRRFLAGLGATALGAALAPRPAARAAGYAGGRAAARLERIGLQLYTVRAAMARDFDGTLARVAAIGYREVEFAGYFDRSPAQVRAALRRHGLVAPAAHVGLEAVRGDWARTLDAARTIGHEWLVVPWLDAEDRSSPDAVRRTAELLNRAGAAARRAGLRFAYHNHDFEFAPPGGRGGVPTYDLLLAGSDPKLVDFELDLYWITKAGQDPLAYFARHPGRFPLVHVKDSAGAPEHRMVDVGRGRIDFAAIFARRKQAGIRHYFVEHDEPADPLASIATSYASLRRLTFP